jgi:hypothetical protein
VLIQDRMERMQAPVLPIWQWLLACSVAVNTRVVTERAFVRLRAWRCNYCEVT